MISRFAQKRGQQSRHHDRCTSGARDDVSRAIRGHAPLDPSGKMPKLRIDNYVAGCQDTKRWRFLSTGKMQ